MKSQTGTSIEFCIFSYAICICHINSTFHAQFWKNIWNCLKLALKYYIHRSFCSVVLNFTLNWYTTISEVFYPQLFWPTKKEIKIWNQTNFSDSQQKKLNSGIKRINVVIIYLFIHLPCLYYLSISLCEW